MGRGRPAGVEPPPGFEPGTSALPGRRSDQAELRRHVLLVPLLLPFLGEGYKFYYAFSVRVQLFASKALYVATLRFTLF